VVRQLLNLPLNSLIAKIRRYFVGAEDDEYADDRWAA
jgi:hypothetical protein